MTLLVIALALAGLWDLYVVGRWGLGSGRTVSWQLYSQAQRYPVIAFAAGYALRWAVPGYEPIVLAAFVCGHIFATMRGA